MRTHAQAILAGLLALHLGGAAAQAQPSSNPARERDNYYITPYEMLEVYGDYPLSSGETLRVTREGRRYYAAMPSTGKVEIVAVGSIAFVTRDRALRFDFTPVAFTTYVWVSRPGAPPATGQARG